MNEYTTHVDENKNESVEKVIYGGLKQFNEENVGVYTRKPFTIYISKDNSEVIAGITGDILHDVCGIHMLWVDKDHRKNNLGTSLLSSLVEHAKIHGCKFIQTDTTDFQAKVFYEKMGFNIQASLPNNFIGHTTYIMRKSL